MKYEGTTYRPPVEADTPLLQVTVGCAHNSCRFCSMYRDVKFRMCKLEEIAEDLQEARQVYRHAPRIFLVNGDAFVLSKNRLKPILKLIHQYFPECETVTMYASIQNIAAKSDEDLVELKVLGVNDLYVGIESGYEKAVSFINKGYTIDEARKQLKRLNKDGIRHAELLMLGVAGAGEGITNARETAKILNETMPFLVWVGTMGVFEGTELQPDVMRGDFKVATEREILVEEKELIKNLDLNGTALYGVHPTNTARVSGLLPRDKNRMIATIDQALEGTAPDFLASQAERKSL
ncbi:MAG: radical SAM protein [Desulfobacterales bacterium]|nr:radical SAM protein [Desulfobacterales bacterium]